MLGKYTPTMENGKPNYNMPGKDSYVAQAGKDHTYFSLGTEWDDIKIAQGLTDNDMVKLYSIALPCHQG